jgi:uncharacterized OsmC-like protein/pimeloyl-ACP methyl ester carboxylesterase
MAEKTERLRFRGAQGALLDARLDWPGGTVHAFALFAHCFTCSKHSVAATRISRALTRRGIAVLRFDFTGQGGSEGELANTDFSSNVGDLVAAAEHLAAHHRAPALLLGHSLGGPASIRAAARLPAVRAVVTIGAPCHPGFLTRLLAPEALERIQREGSGSVRLGGSTLVLTRAFLEDIAEQPILECLRRLAAALLVFHSPQDAVVPVEQAQALVDAAPQPRSFIALDGADHFLSRAEDSVYVADVVGAWASRYLGAGLQRPEDLAPLAANVERVVAREVRAEGPFADDVQLGRYRVRADEPAAYGGRDTGPSPYDLLVGALGACTNMTLRLYADRKGWPLEHVETRLRHSKLHAKDCAACETQEGRVDRIEREVRLEGPLSPEQRERLLAMAERCPVHRTLEGEVEVRTRLAGAGGPDAAQE